ncbi:MAG: guanylate kinase [Gemmatimonadota bacterium]
MNPFPLILSSPSGGGKTTIARILLRRRQDLGYSISCTTRSPRVGERDGEDYHFLTPDEFSTRRANGEFAESAEVHGNQYGTLRSEVDRVFAAGRHVVMDIDIQGARQFVAAYPESVLVFLLPPSAKILMGRLTERQTEAPDAVRRRLIGARDELAAVDQYQYVVVNDDLEIAIAQVASIIDAETVRHRRVPLLEDRVRQLMDGLDREITQYERAT